MYHSADRHLYEAVGQVSDRAAYGLPKIGLIQIQIAVITKQGGDIDHRQFGQVNDSVMRCIGDGVAGGRGDFHAGGQITIRQAEQIGTFSGNAE